jgi:acyl-CoA synthetase (NDP forming)/RimJ/RimL family protein N-acetyltransferase
VADASHAYPAHWEADVVLRDGGTAHLRPILPTDAGRLRSFQARLSDETIYNRFFSLYRELSDRDVERFTVVDHRDRAALIALIGDDLIGVVRYERVGPGEAEVAFNIEDDHQGRGLGSVFLEHIAAAARENGIGRFVADVLPSNRKMLRVFGDAGYVVAQGFDDGVVRLSFDLEPTEDSLAVTYAREHRAEARSVQRLLEPESVVVVGAGRNVTSLGRVVLEHVLGGGFTGRAHVVNREADEEVGVAGLPSYRSVRDLPEPVDLAVLAIPAVEVEAVVADCAARGVRALVVVSAGFAESGPEGEERQRRLVALARGSGMRVLGPSSFGIINTAPDRSLNASLAPHLPPAGRLGFFSQSGALGVALLDNVVGRGLGLSTFASAGNRVDVSGNDLLQYWEEDDATDAVLLYLESLGNPRKFSRIARRLARRKPVVVVKSGRFRGERPGGHLVRLTQAPAAAVDALFRRAGVIRADSIHQMFDVAALVATQPLPEGRRVALVGNSDALAVLAEDAAEEAGLEVTHRRDLGPDASAEDFRGALATVFDDPDVDSVVALFIPPLTTPDADVARVLAAASATGAKTVVSTFLGMPGVPEALRAPGGGRGSVPSYSTPEDAVRALALVTGYADWRTTPAGHTVSPSGLDVRSARALVTGAIDTAEGVTLDDGDLTRLLACYGIDLWATRPAATADEAVAAAEALGFPVALKATAAHLQHRRELGGVRLDLEDADQLRSAFASMATRHGERAGGYVVQAMAPTGVATRLATVEDRLFGPVVSFGLGGAATDLLGDRSYGVPPLTDDDLAALVSGVRAAPLLLGYEGSPPGDIAALHDLLARLARLADDLPEVAALELNPVVVAPTGVAVLAARARLARPAVRADRAARALSG